MSDFQTTQHLKANGRLEAIAATMLNDFEQLKYITAWIHALELTS